MGKHVLTVIVGVLVGVSLLLYMFAFQVRQNEKAVLLRFGRPVSQPEPGYHFKWPWPIEKERVFDGRIIFTESKPEETVTNDSHNIVMSLCTGWQIKDAVKFNETFGSAGEYYQEEAWLKLDGFIRDSAMIVMGQHKLGELVTVDRAQLKYDDIEAEIKARANENARATYGIEVAFVKLRRLELPESSLKNVYDRMMAERKKVAQAIESDGDQKANVIKAEATSQRDSILANARAEAISIKGQGDADAAAHYKNFASNPELAIYLLKVRALVDVLKSKATIVVDTSNPLFDIFQQGPPELKAPAAAAVEGPAEISKKPRNN